MKKLSFKSRILVSSSLVLAISLIVTGVIFVVLNLFANLLSVQRFMIREISEVIDKHLVVKNEKIFFQRDSEERTLSAYLRDEGLSAIVVESTGKVVGKYGLYKTYTDQQLTEKWLRSGLNNLNVSANQVKFDIQNLYEKRNYLVSLSPISTESGVVGMLVLAADLNFGGQVLWFTLLLLSFVLVTSIFLGWLFLKMVINRSFVPFEKVLNHMSDVEVKNLKGRIEMDGSRDDEVVRLSRTYNDMLNRIDEGVEKQKEFVSNASHELKTPLTQAVLELDAISLALKKKKIKKSIREIEEVKSDLLEMGNMLVGLLSLARIKKHTLRIETDVTQETKKVIKKYKAESQNKKMEVVFEAHVLGRVLVSGEHWNILISNLISNSIKHGKVGEKILINMEEDGKKARLRIENKGESLKGINIRRLAERFYRGSREVSGYGIGLSVVREIVEYYGWQLSVRSKRDQNFIVEIREIDLV